MKKLLRGGFVVTPRGSRRADVLLDGEKIAQVGHISPAEAISAEVTDVSGCYLFPGFIDAHTHFDLDVCNTTTADDFASGTRSAIRGGTTTIIEEELIKADLPVELRALPIIESALSTTATSPMGAVGLWQFMPATGKSYGLEINSFVDERRDPVQATRAACRYLKDLYSIYHDWTLAIAAYNCGPGTGNIALARAGGGTSFAAVSEITPSMRAAASSAAPRSRAARRTPAAAS